MKLTFSDLHKALEAERNDISYRKPFAQAEVHVVTKTVKVIPEKIKKLYFHAGRHASGDRDSLAIQAWHEYEKVENL